MPNKGFFCEEPVLFSILFLPIAKSPMPSPYHLYRDLRDRLEIFRSSTNAHLSVHFPPYQPNLLKSQIIQSIANKVFEYTHACDTILKSTGQAPSIHTPISCDSFSFVTGNELSVSYKNLFYVLVRSSVYWTYILFILLTSFRLQPKKIPHSLLYGVSPQNIFSADSDHQFIEFCKNSRIEPLVRQNPFLVQAPTDSESSNHLFSYTKFPLLRLLQLNGLDISDLLQLLFSHTSYFFFFLYSTFRYPPAVFLYRDFLEHSLFSWLNSRNLIIDLLYTTSNYQYQLLPSWALPNRTFKTHLLWYSHSFFPLTYKADRVSYPITGISYIQIDKHWVWSDCFREFLKTYSPPAEIEVCPPIIWQNLNSNPRTNSSSSDVTRLTLFDVTPFSDEWLHDHGLENNYISYHHSKKFLDDILDATSRIAQNHSIKIEILLKPKESMPQSIHKLISTIYILLAPPSNSPLLILVFIPET